MRRLFLALVIFLAMAGQGWAATYYVAQGGTAADKTAATGAAYPDNYMSPLTHDAQTFASGDTIYLSDAGGNILGRGTDITVPLLTPPTSGVTYNKAPTTSPVLECRPVAAGAGTALAVEGASNDNPAQLTITGHGYANGNKVWLCNLAGGTWATKNNALYTVTKVNDNVITLAFDGTGLGAYTASSGLVGKPYSFGIKLYNTGATPFVCTLQNFTIQGSAGGTTYGAGTPPTQNLTGAGLWVDGNQTTSLSGLTISASGSENLHIVKTSGSNNPTVTSTGNTYSSGGNDGIGLHNGTLTCTGDTFQGNLRGIASISTFGQLNVYSSTFSDNSQGISMGHNTYLISGNTFNIYNDTSTHMAVGEAGISLANSSATNALVTGNTFNIITDTGSQFAKAITANGAYACTSSGNTITTDAGLTQKSYGYLLQGGASVVFDGTDTFTNLQYGIYNTSNAAMTVKGSFINCNRSINNTGTSLSTDRFWSYGSARAIYSNAAMAIRNSIFNIPINGYGAYLDTAGVNGSTIYNCTMRGAKNGDKGIYTNNAGATITVTNNIFNNLASGITNGGTCNYDHNDFTGNTEDTTGGTLTDGGGNLAVAPVFLNAGGSYALATDFKLSATSPIGLKAIGANLSATFTTDFAGSTRGVWGMGAYLSYPGGGGLSIGLGLSGGNYRPWTQ